MFRSCERRQMAAIFSVCYCSALFSFCTNALVCQTGGQTSLGNFSHIGFMFASENLLGSEIFLVSVIGSVTCSLSLKIYEVGLEVDSRIYPVNEKLEIGCKNH